MSIKFFILVIFHKDPTMHHPPQNVSFQDCFNEVEVVYYIRKLNPFCKTSHKNKNYFLPLEYLANSLKWFINLQGILSVNLSLSKVSAMRHLLKWLSIQGHTGLWLHWMSLDHSAMPLT